MPRRFIVTLLSCATLLAASAPARGEAKAPPQAWARVVEGFAKALVSGDLNAAGALLAHRASVRAFGGASDDEVWRVFERVGNGSLVGRHAYVHPPAVMATEIAADVRDHRILPDAVKARFALEDGADMRRANATAVQWLEAQLEARQGTLVGVIVLWVPRAADGGHDPAFVLLKGEAATGGTVKIRQVVYGVPVS